MKRVLLLSLSLLVGMVGFAQVKNQGEISKKSRLTHVRAAYDGTEMSSATSYAPSATLPSTSNILIKDAGDVELMPTMVTNYDLQSNSCIGNRIAAWPDGSVAVTATWDYSGSTSYPDRGTGYNFYANGEFGEMPEERQEPAKSGWPSICAYGDGEILASHNTGVNVYYRATKGEGEWTLLANLQTGDHAWTWPRVVATADGSLLLMVCDQVTENGHNVSYVSLYKSTDGGQNWTENPTFNALSLEYNKLLSADDYVMAVNGNRVAVAFFSMTYDIFYMYSEDAGETWTKEVVCEHPYKTVMGTNFDWGQTEVAENDSIRWTDNSGSIAIGNDGTVHMTWTIGRWHPAPSSGWGYYSSFYFTPFFVYWNSNYTNEQGTHCIPTMGNWSGDEEHMSEWNWPGTVLGAHDYTMSWERIELLEEAAGDGTLHMYGFASEQNPGDEEGPDFDSDVINNVWGTYRTFDGYGTMPSIAVDSDNNIYILYSGLSDKRTGSTSTGTTYYYRSPFLHLCVNGVWQEWYEATVVATGTAHNEEEAYSVTAYPNDVDGNMWFIYSADEEFGLVLDEDQNDLTDNTIYAVKIASYESVAETRDVVYNIYPNPASDYICIAADANADATITFVNLAGQTVKSYNKALTVGQNSLSIDLESGVYFCTVNANGFSKTVKVVVK